jgi:hypothetical protein
LPPWETNFLSSVTHWCLNRKLMSGRQRETALRIVEKFA